MSLSSKLNRIGATCLVVGMAGFLSTAVYEDRQYNKSYKQYAVRAPAISQTIDASIAEIRNIKGEGLRPYSIPLSANLPPEYFNLVSLQESNRIAMLIDYINSATQTSEYVEYAVKDKEAKRKGEEKIKGLRTVALSFLSIVPLGAMSCLFGSILKSKRREEEGR